MITIENITKSFGSLQVLKGIDLHIDRGEVVSIVGPSGAGKTTLLQIMGTLDRPDSGSVHVDSVDVTALSQKKLADFRNRHIGFVFQFHQLLPEFTALENIMIPAYIAGTSQKTAKQRAQELLQFMGLADRWGADHRNVQKAVAHVDGAVGNGGEALVVSDDDEGLAELVAEVEEELVQLLLVLRVERA